MKRRRLRWRWWLLVRAAKGRRHVIRAMLAGTSLGALAAGSLRITAPIAFVIAVLAAPCAWVTSVVAESDAVAEWWQAEDN